MRTTCKSCGAPLHSKKCEYCGAVYSENQQIPEQVTSNLDYDKPKSKVENTNNTPLINKNKLTINTVTGIFAIINVIVLSFYNTFLLTGYEGTEAESIMLGLLLFTILLMMIAALVLHIVGLVKSKKHGISIVGHILGIIGAAITLLTFTLLSVISIILFLLAAIFILQQKNVRAINTRESQGNQL